MCNLIHKKILIIFKVTIFKLYLIEFLIINNNNYIIIIRIRVIIIILINK